jgi:hypothetical protein
VEPLLLEFTDHIVHREALAMHRKQRVSQTGRAGAQTNASHQTASDDA